MPTPLEAEISEMLQDGNDPVLIADDLVRRWERNLLSESQQSDCARFLVASSQYIRLFEQVVRLADENQSLPWTDFAEALGRGHVQIKPEEMNALLEGAQEQNQVAEFVQSRQLDLWDKRLAALRATSADQKQRDYANRKVLLREKLEFMRSQRLSSEEAKVLDEIQQLFPNDPQFASEKEAFEIRSANEIINNFTHSQNNIAEDLLWKSQRLSPELNEAKIRIVERAREIIAKSPQNAYDLALAMHFMDFNHDSLELLSLVPRPVDPVRARSSDWLRLELMIRARQFVNVLDYTGQIEIIYANEPETAFAVTYARARALWGLGQHEMAVDLLSSLVRIRPNYRSASSLLTDWIEQRGGEA